MLHDVVLVWPGLFSNITPGHAQALGLGACKRLLSPRAIAWLFSSVRTQWKIPRRGIPYKKDGKACRYLKGLKIGFGISYGVWLDAFAVLFKALSQQNMTVDNMLYWNWHLLSPSQTIATFQHNISQHCWPSICKSRQNERNVSTQHNATSLDVTCCARLANCCDVLGIENRTSAHAQT